MSSFECETFVPWELAMLTFQHYLTNCVDQSIRIDLCMLGSTDAVFRALDRLMFMKPRTKIAIEGIIETSHVCQKFCSFLHSLPRWTFQSEATLVKCCDVVSRGRRPGFHLGIVPGGLIASLVTWTTRGQIPFPNFFLNPKNLQKLTKRNPPRGGVPFNFLLKHKGDYLYKGIT